ncbi:MAG: hypothetical protein GXX79_21085 [Actinomycetales bacterium]|nr:hypothetical protein [Actinomycetales bacterium]
MSQRLVLLAVPLALVAVLTACSNPPDVPSGQPGAGLSGSASTSGTGAGEETGSTTASTSASPTTSDEVRPVRVEGYEYRKPSKGISKALGGVDPANPAFTAASTNGVARNGKFVADLAIYRVSDETAALKDFEDVVLAMVKDSMAGPGTTTKKVTIAGQKVSRTAKGQAVIYVWYRDAKLVMVMTDKSLATGKAFVTAYLKAS